MPINLLCILDSASGDVCFQYTRRGLDHDSSRAIERDLHCLRHGKQPSRGAVYESMALIHWVDAEPINLLYNLLESFADVVHGDLASCPEEGVREEVKSMHDLTAYDVQVHSHTLMQLINSNDSVATYPRRMEPLLSIQERRHDNWLVGRVAWHTAIYARQFDVGRLRLPEQHRIFGDSKQRRPGISTVALYRLPLEEASRRVYEVSVGEEQLDVMVKVPIDQLQFVIRVEGFQGKFLQPPTLQHTAWHADGVLAWQINSAVRGTSFKLHFKCQSFDRSHIQGSWRTRHTAAQVGTESCNADYRVLSWSKT
jgi:hypothetical protein